jgi:hypothetical protein
MNDHDLETQLSRSLDQHASGLHDAPFTFDDVRGRARGIQRRRRGAGLVAAVAVLAIAVPIGLSGGSGSDDSRTIDPAPAPSPARATVLHAGELTLPGGQTIPVPYDDVYELAPLADGRFVLMLQDRAVVLDASGAEVGSYPVLANELTAGAADRSVAWVGADRHVQVLETGRAEPDTLAKAPAASTTIMAMLNDRCAENLCVVLLGDGNTVTHRVDLESTTSYELPFTRITDVNVAGDRYAVEVPGADEQYGCSELYDPVNDVTIAQNCDTSLLRFSPDEQHLVGMRGDNGVFGELEVVDVDLQPVLTWAPEDGQVISSAGWSDGGHLEVAVVDLDTQEWSLVRVPIDGGPVEVVEEPAAGGDPSDGPEYVFAE